MSSCGIIYKLASLDYAQENMANFLNSQIQKNFEHLPLPPLTPLSLVPHLGTSNHFLHFQTLIIMINTSYLETKISYYQKIRHSFFNNKARIKTQGVVRSRCKCDSSLLNSYIVLRKIFR
jgi:hypothetical protein